MSGRDYRAMGAPHFVLQLSADQDPAKADVFFVDREGNETEVSGIMTLSYNAAIGAELEWPEIEMVVTGKIRFKEDE